MSIHASDNNTDIAALCKLAEKKYRAWWKREIEPERERRLDEVNRRRDLGFGGQALLRLEVYRDLLISSARKRIGIYASVASEHSSAAMLSRDCLTQLREEVMQGVEAQYNGLRDLNERKARAACYEGAVPSRNQYDLIRSKVLDIVNAELDVLEASVLVAVSDEPRQTTTVMKGGVVAQHGEAVGWEHIEITFLSELKIQVHNRGQAEAPCNYHEMGFVDGRTTNPNKAWLLLRQIAESNGTLTSSAKGPSDWSKVEKSIQNIRKTLRQHFGISDDPILFVRGSGYRTKFKIHCSPAYHE